MTLPAAFPATHLLVVDDDDRLRELLQHYLGEHGFFVSAAANTQEADALLACFTVDAMVLDVMMPHETGLAYAARLAQTHPAPPPILLLTALGETEDRIAGLEAGAVDYLAKPFAPRELLLQVENILKLRRTRERVPPEAPPARADHAPTAPPVLAFGPYRFDPRCNQLTREGVAVYLTSGEADCLRMLAAHAGTPVSREAMAQQLGAIANVRSVDVQMNRLRKKIEPHPSRPLYLQTIRHAGYVLYAQPQAGG